MNGPVEVNELYDDTPAAVGAFVTLEARQHAWTPAELVKHLATVLPELYETAVVDGPANYPHTSPIRLIVTEDPNLDFEWCECSCGFARLDVPVPPGGLTAAEWLGLKS